MENEVTEKQPFTLDDFWALKNVTEVQLSPDGKTVAYVVERYDEAKNALHSAIWLADLETGRARQFTSGETVDMQPRWSPDGDLIAFTSNRTETSEHNLASDVWVVNVESGDMRCLTDGGVSALLPAWSPDSQTLAFYASREWLAHGVNDTHLWTVSRSG